MSNYRFFVSGAVRDCLYRTFRKLLFPCISALLLAACNGQTAGDGYGIQDLILTNQAEVDTMSTNSISPDQDEIGDLTKKDLSDGYLVAVDRGDTVEDLSERYGVPVRSILAANQVGNSNFQLGQIVLIPHNCEPFCHEYVYH